MALSTQLHVFHVLHLNTFLNVKAVDISCIQQEEGSRKAALCDCKALNFANVRCQLYPPPRHGCGGAERAADI